MPRIGLDLGLSSMMEEIASAIKRFWQDHVDHWENQAQDWDQAT
tara:strand:+ start:3720 stop:3851 length:132 start_codon:yes stop_codon:yes gene_type:complete